MNDTDTTLLSGSMMAAAGVTGGADLAASWFDIRSQADLQAFLQRAAGPTVARVKTQLAPWKVWFEVGRCKMNSVDG